MLRNCPANSNPCDLTLGYSGYQILTLNVTELQNIRMERRSWSVIQLVDCPEFINQALHKPGMVVQVCNPSTWEAKTRRLGVRSP